MMMALKDLGALQEAEEKRLQDLADQEAFKSLCYSLIIRSLRDLVNYRDSSKRKDQRIYKEVYSWIYGGIEDPELVPEELDPDEIEVEDNHVSQDEAKKLLIKFERSMSFEEVCDTIGWDPDCTRERAGTLTKEDLPKLKLDFHGME